ncbi:hypothetical protein Cs7R123_23680 [Catellatospora sp. TT07R-123]|nr:hypothetical protein Cs7R123_23680 [Catellatospora sp. TT07R-123]
MRAGSALITIDWEEESAMTSRLPVEPGAVATRRPESTTTAPRPAPKARFSIDVDLSGGLFSKIRPPDRPASMLSRAREGGRQQRSATVPRDGAARGRAPQ